MKNLILSLILILSVTFLNAQTQTIRGRILDKQSQYALPGATIQVLGTEPLIGNASDTEGYFELKNVPLGRQTIRVSYIGYLEQTIPNVIVTSGKEVILNVSLEEQVTMSQEVVITAEKDKTVTNNELATVSSRSFTIEESSRYAGSRNDPSRMASNYAGVSGANDARNDIVIRGNSPSTLLWRLEGIDIPSPNHYGTLGTTGGPVSILNNNVLDNSDFMTGAFPAEYGNAIGGVFDLKLRSGNNTKREYLFQIGFAGFEAGLEGPFSKSSKSTYLLNYRYSTLAVFNALGIPFGTGEAVPQYQDLSFKFDFPTKKVGRFSVFGIGGLSTIELFGSKQDKPDPNDNFGDINNDSDVKNGMGVLGLTHTFFYNPTTYSEVTLSVSGAYNRFTNDSLSRNQDGEVIDRRFESATDQNQLRYSLRAQLNKKFNAKNNVNFGIMADIFQSDLIDSALVHGTGRFIINNKFNGSSALLRAYAQWQHRFSERLTLNSGVQYQQFLLNDTYAIEPRVGLKYKLSAAQSLSFGFGLHSQLQPIQVYFQEANLSDGTRIRSNENLDFTRSMHFVLAYDHSLSNDLRLKVETYYQRITDAPVETTPSSFSMLNFGSDFGFPERNFLINSGEGYNYGLELTLEKFYSKGYYFLLTGSLFDSKYEGSDGIERNTAFNGNYVANLLLGKEFKIKDKNALFFDTKFTVAGGRRFTPINLAASRQAGYEILSEELAFSEQFTSYMRWDVKAGYRINAKRMTHEFFVDVQNVMNRDNVLGQRYNRTTQQVGEIFQLGFFPVIQYKLQF